jgi:hypothetical protein
MVNNTFQKNCKFLKHNFKNIKNKIENTNVIIKTKSKRAPISPVKNIRID